VGSRPPTALIAKRNWLPVFVQHSYGLMSHNTTRESWRALAARHQRASTGRASWQIVNSVCLYLALWCAMAWTIRVSWWLTMPLVVLAAGIFIRVFIIFHDCGHGSFFRTAKANNVWGFLTGVLTFTPYQHWRRVHAIHHGTTGNLDSRGIGDVWTMTVQEYESATPSRRFAYRVARSPFVLLLIAPSLMFIFEHRLPRSGAGPRERRSVWLTNLCLLAFASLMTLVIGLLPFLVIQVTIIALAGAVGVWLFYSQHQFEGAYWRRTSDWSHNDAALRGSAFLKLPRWAQWITGNIGFHHIHHLDSRIPNYRLQECHESLQLDNEVSPLTIFRSLCAFGLKLWDEANGRLVRFRQSS